MFGYVIPTPLLGHLVRNGGRILGLNCRFGRTTSEFSNFSLLLLVVVCRFEVR